MSNAKSKRFLLTAPEARSLAETGTAEVWREMKQQPHKNVGSFVSAASGEHWIGQYHNGDPMGVLSEKPAFWKSSEHSYRCPFGPIGGELWGAETWLYVGPGSGSDLPDYVEERAKPKNHKAKNCWYRATDKNPDELKWRPSTHMPQWASRFPRLTLQSVRVEKRDGKWGWVGTVVVTKEVPA